MTLDPPPNDPERTEHILEQLDAPATKHQAMKPAIVIEQSRLLPVSPEIAFAGTHQIPLKFLFPQWHGSIPSVRATRGQTGDWNTVGQVREIVLANGASLIQTLTILNPPRSLGYRLSDLHGPLAPLIDHVDALWTFDASGTGTQVTWQCTMHPNSALATPLMPPVVQIWTVHAKNVLDHLSEYIARRRGSLSRSTGKYIP
jgi:hypothetical protein